MGHNIEHNIEQGPGGGDILKFVEIQRFCGICPKTFETDCRYIFLKKFISKQQKI
jgi:hypothetical protein